MNITGYLTNEKTGNPTPGKVSIAFNGVLLIPVIEVDGKGMFWVNNMPDGATLTIEANGYKKQVWQSAELSEGNNIFMLQPDTNILPVLGIAAAALYFGAKKIRVGALSSEKIAPVLLIGGGLIAFSVIQKVLQGLGIWDSPDTKNLDQESTNPASPWNPNYWKGFSNYSYAITTSVAAAYSKEIYDSFGAFNDCEECAKAVIRRMRTQANLSFLVDVFYQKYGQDLLNFLRGGWWPQDRLSDSDVNELNQYIKNLPTN
jgi:hypothetical protein